MCHHGSIWDSWPIAFSGYPRGSRVGCETGCPRRHRASNFLVETRSRTRVSQVPGKPPLGFNPRDGTEPWEHSSCLWVQISGVEAYSFLPDDQQTDTFFVCEITQTDQTTHVNNRAVDIPPIACRPPRGATMSGDRIRATVAWGRPAGAGVQIQGAVGRSTKCARSSRAHGSKEARSTEWQRWVLLIQMRLLAFSSITPTRSRERHAQAPDRCHSPRSLMRGPAR
jgi:hypothetical protein